MKPHSLFFDMDGTLVDSEPIHYRAYAALLAEYDISFPETLFNSFVGKSTLTNIRWIKHHYSLEGDETLLAKRKKSYFTSFLDSITLFPHVPELLAAAAQQYPLVLITSTKLDLTRLILEATHLIPYFSHVVTGDEGLPKPDPSLYVVALRKSALAAAHVVAFEDSSSGYEAATKAGILCHCVPNKYTSHQFNKDHLIVPTLEEAVKVYL